MRTAATIATRPTISLPRPSNTDTAVEVVVGADLAFAEARPDDFFAGARRCELFAGDFLELDDERDPEVVRPEVGRCEVAKVPTTVPTCCDTTAAFTQCSAGG